MQRTTSALLLLMASGCIHDDGIFFDDEFIDTGFSGREADCLRWQPAIVNLIDGVTETTVQLASVCDFPVTVQAVRLDDPDSAFVADAVDVQFPQTLDPLGSAPVQIRFVATDGAAHEGQLLSEVESFDTDVNVAAVAQLYGKLGE